MDEFFVRFCLQKSLGIFDDNLFDCDSLLSFDKNQREIFIKECEDIQKEQAETLSKNIELTGITGKKVLFIGDSLTADRLGYRGIVTYAAGLDSSNMAISGATSADMVRYVYPNTINFSPDIVSILIGTNDAVLIGGEPMINHVSNDEYKRNIERIIDVAKGCGAAVIIMTIPECDEETFNSSNDIAVKQNSNQNISKYNKIIRIAAKNRSAHVVDVNEFLKKYPKEDIFEADGIHLTSYAHFIVAEKWLKTAAEVCK